MNEAIETREAITVTLGGSCLRGTYHKAHSSSSAGPGEKNRIGVLFLNPGFQPRAASGDSAVYWADAFGKGGYPCFRVDLPGFGDSDGDAPAKILDFVNAGGYGSIVSATIKELVGRYNLAGMVIMGLCAGAVTALFAASISKECKGLVLMDPYFFLPQERTKVREGLSYWSSWSRIGAVASDLYDRFRYFRLLLKGNQLPRNANLPLLRGWNQLMSAGMPILVFKAPSLKARGLKPRVGEFDYLDYLQATSGRGGRLVVQFVENTNHSFADRLGRAAVRRYTEQWLNTYFPSTEGETAVNSLAVNSSHPGKGGEQQQPCPLG